jgi:PTS system N-acetylgalactosamine-specific IIA component
VFLTDLLGGTPFRVASTLAMQKPGSEVITGTNLQLLLEMVLERDGLSSEAFRLQALECGHRGLTSLVDELGRCREEARLRKGYEPAAARATDAYRTGLAGRPPATH